MQSVATNCTLKRIECLYLCRSVATDSAGRSATLISTRKGRGCGVPARWLHCCGVIARCAGLERAEAPCQRAGRVKAPCQRAGRVKAPRQREERRGAAGGAARRGERRGETRRGETRRSEGGDGVASHPGYPVRLHPRAPRPARLVWLPLCPARLVWLPLCPAPDPPRTPCLSDVLLPARASQRLSTDFELVSIERRQAAGAYT